MKYTKGTLAVMRGVEPDGIHRCGITTKRGNLDYLVATVENGAPGDTCDTELANAERFVTCWNAMAGIEDPQAFVDAVKKYMAHDSTVGDMDEAHAALATLMPEEPQ